MRPDALRKRTALLDIATELILEKGYEAASMNELIARAGGSKSSVYKHFGSKEELLIAVIDASVERHHQQLKAIDIENLEIRPALTKTAKIAIEVITSKTAIDLCKVVYRASNSHPAIGLAYFEYAPTWGEQLLARFLEHRHKKGEIFCPKPLEAAEFFWSMLLYKPMMLAYCNLYAQIDKKYLSKHIKHTVDRFLLYLESLK